MTVDELIDLTLEDVYARTLGYSGRMNELMILSGMDNVLREAMNRIRLGDYATNIFSVEEERGRTRLVLLELKSEILTRRGLR